MAFKVTGRVFESESRRGVPGLVVRAIDKDLIYDDLVGESHTDADGRFKIIYEEKDFKELFEGAPDLYLVVKSPDRSRVLFSSEDAVRCSADVHERFAIALSKAGLGNLSPSAGIGFGRQPGNVTARLRAGDGKPISARKLLILTEHKPIAKREHRLVIEGDDDFTLNLDPGTYTVQAYADGHGVARGVVDVVSGQRVDLDFDLEPMDLSSLKKTLDERLAVYGLSQHDVGLDDLSLSKGKTLELNYRKHKKLQGFTMLKARSVGDLKRWLGSKDETFAHDRPRFGALPNYLTKAVDDDPTSWTSTIRTDLVKVAHEYIHGNSQSVMQFEEYLNWLIGLVYAPMGLTITIPFFGYTTVTIGPDAVLEIGHDSSVFFCDVLRIHKTGILRIVGQVRADIGRYEEWE